VHGDHGEEGGAEVAGAEADACKHGPAGLAGLQRNLTAVAADGVALGLFDAFEGDLYALEGRVDAADGAAGDGLFGENVPRLEGFADFHAEGAGLDGTEAGEAEFEMSAEPCIFKGEA
jgi:hypothetical protein